jgi:predicted nucleotidyltransferase
MEGRISPMPQLTGETGSVLKDIKSRLQRAFGDRLRGVVLYGSLARCHGGPESDIDVLVLLNGPVESWNDVKACSDAVYPVILRIGRTIDAMPVDVKRYEEGKAPLYVNARREGVRL